MSALPPGVRIDDDGVSFTSKAGVSFACDRAVAMPAQHMLPLLQAAGRGDLALLSIHAPDTAFPTSRLEEISRSVVVLVGDDPWPDGASVGPLRWECARRLRYWRPHLVVVHGTGPLPEHYRVAVDAARLVGRIALIETDSAHIEEWADFLGCPNTMRIRPPAGCVHPEAPDRQVMQ